MGTAGVTAASVVVLVTSGVAGGVVAGGGVGGKSGGATNTVVSSPLDEVEFVLLTPLIGCPVCAVVACVSIDSGRVAADGFKGINGRRPVESSLSRQQ